MRWCVLVALVGCTPEPEAPPFSGRVLLTIDSNTPECATADAEGKQWFRFGWDGESPPPVVLLATNAGTNWTYTADLAWIGPNPTDDAAPWGIRVRCPTAEEGFRVLVVTMYDDRQES